MRDSLVVKLEGVVVFALFDFQTVAADTRCAYCDSFLNKLTVRKLHDFFILHGCSHLPLKIFRKRLIEKINQHLLRQDGLSCWDCEVIPAMKELGVMELFF